MNNSIIKHDIVIVGGGLVGSSLAIALAKLGKNIAIIEATDFNQMPSVFDQRNLSFSAATINALTTLGIIPLLQTAMGNIQTIHISRQGDFGRVILEAPKYNREYFGKVVVARDFGVALEQRLQQFPCITRYRPARFIGWENSTLDGYRLLKISTASGEQSIAARLVVAADGTSSQVRESAGISTQSHHYQQQLWVARLQTQYPPSGVAYERFGEYGPTALLPRGDGYFGVVHGASVAESESLSSQTDAAWLARLQSVVGWRVGRLLAIGERSVYPLTRVLVDKTVAERVVVLGNAAQTLHPIGAQGFNLGLRDALTLAELVSACGDNDLGSDSLLNTYQLQRAEDRKQTIDFSHQLAQITSNRSMLIKPLRSLGLMAIAQSASLQSLVVSGAMGFRGNVPELCRGEK